jgi:polyphosphate kinase
MPRNFDRRVEAVVPIEDPALHVRMRRLLETSLADNRQSWDLRGDGSYLKRIADGVPEISAHATFMSDSWGLPLPEAPRPARRVDVVVEPAARPQDVAGASF